MFHWKVIDPDSALGEAYRLRTLEAFPQLSKELFPYGMSIGIFYNEKLVGGVTLQDYENLAMDFDIAENWKILRPQRGVRMTRLWAERTHHTTALPYIFKGILDTVAEDVFLYGVLSLPLGFALKRSEVFSEHEDILVPKLPLHECQWDPEATPTSQGKRLLQTYLSLGAKFLGPSSGSFENQSVKVVMGLERSKAALPERFTRHA